MRFIHMRRVFVAFAILIALSLVAVGVRVFAFDNRQGQPSKWARAEVELGEIQKALNSHWLETKQYPDSLDMLTKKYFKNGVPKNPFTKEQYDYVTTGDRFFLVCYGRDEKAGGAAAPDADIVYSEQGCLTR
jgi:hypothetical protein